MSAQAADLEMREAIARAMAGEAPPPMPPAPPSAGDQLRDNGNMDHERRLTAVEAAVIRIDAILSTLATKADLEGYRAEITRWMLATVVGLFIGFAGLFFAMSNTLKSAPVAPPQPIIITLPAGAATQPPAAPAPR